MTEQDYRSKHDVIESTYKQKLGDIVEIRSHFEQRVSNQTSDQKNLNFDQKVKDKYYQEEQALKQSMQSELTRLKKSYETQPKPEGQLGARHLSVNQNQQNNQVINFKNVKSKVINLNVAQIKDQPYRSSSKGSGPVFNESLISESETKHETQLQQIGKKGYSTLNSARETPDIELGSQELTRLSK